jgi:hypothetical protein
MQAKPFTWMTFSMINSLVFFNFLHSLKRSAH